ncbi:MAG: hypothetical protein KatS3mg023_0371 [Armatimonadota bacterium]|nr:MAG: hypothetical protein KatS3mg023_0371 [Armatimonadota bacterium]
MLRIVSDGAQWIRDWAQQLRQSGFRVEHVLDWYHLKKKCYELSSLFYGGVAVKRQLLRRLLRALWGGEVDTALGILSSYRTEARHVLVARRQKGRGMRWGEAVSDGLAALQTLLWNGGWDMYWQEGRTLPLAAA